MAQLLIVDDEQHIRENLMSIFDLCGYRVFEADNGVRACTMLARQQFDLVFTDFRMAEMNGFELLKTVKQVHPDSLVVLMTAFATVENAIVAMRAGAYDYVTKPFAQEQIRAVAERALQFRRLKVENRELHDRIEETPLLESHSPAMSRLLRAARQAADSETSILLTGESGTGKSVLACQIHRWSNRREHPFVVVNCTTLSEELLENKRFGLIREAFGRGVGYKAGELEATHDGTVFLDEIADLSASLQTKLLRFVKEQSFEREGSCRTIQMNTRIIAASNRDLSNEVATKRFREDLFYRLNVITLHIPPLRERREDILPLCDRLLKSARIRNWRSNMALSPEAAAAITQYCWPGNVRELRTALERAVVLTRDDTIQSDDLPDWLFRQECPSHVSHSTSLEEVKREHTLRVLAKSANLEEAAFTLGISPPTLRRRRKRYRID
jgi:two-component system, NtrC family, response regulator AlgB